MKIAIINTYSNGSTGTIASLIGEYANQEHEVKYFYGRDKQTNSNWEYIGENKLEQNFSNFLTFLTGYVGSFHKKSTNKLIKQLGKFNPDVIHLHNIHGNYLNFDILFSYLYKFKGKVIITMHDEFLITGRCALCFCDKWKTGCKKCKFLSAYPRALLDHSEKLQQKKLEMISKIKNLQLVTPSKWLMNLIDESMLKGFKKTCVYNGLTEPVFEEFDLSNIIEKGKINLCFSAFTWSINKGALIIKELAKLLDLNKYNIIIVGYGDYCSSWFDFPCKKVTLLSRKQMLTLLKECDLFINPTFKDNLPTILIESLQVGTPAITFDTGGCSEIIDNKCGFVLKEKTSMKLKEAIENFDFTRNYFENCLKKSEVFSAKNMAETYLKIYKEFF